MVARRPGNRSPSDRRHPPPDPDVLADAVGVHQVVHERSGGDATSAARAGRRLDTIRAQTGHRSLDMLAEYLAHDVPWDDDAAKGLL